MTIKNLSFMVFILLLIAIPSLSAIGITPGRTTIDFEPNLERDINFTVVNSEYKNMNVAFVVDGELADYITLSNEVVYFEATKDKKDFSYTLNLPLELAPGLHKANVIATELPENISGEEIIVRATVSVVTQIYVYVPYPGKYIDANLEVVADDESGNVFFYIPIISRGEEEINSVKSFIDIYSQGEIIASIETDDLQISPGKRKELSTVWIPDVALGEYTAKARINYDENELNLEKAFRLGGDFIEILGVSANDFKLSEVARIKVLVQNRQTEKVDEATASFKIYDNQLEEIASLQSENYEVPALSNKELIVYWDTEFVDKGQYSSELRVDYNDEFISRNLRIDIDDDSMIFTGIGFVISSDIERKFNAMSIAIIVIGILALANLVWFLWWLRKKRDKSKKN